MKKSVFTTILTLIAGIIIFSSCVKEKPDVPPETTIPFDPEQVWTIDSLKFYFDKVSFLVNLAGNDLDSLNNFLEETYGIKANTDGTYSITTGMYSLFCNVTMDEKSGNIYKAAYVQDPTGAIQLNFLSSGGMYVGDSVRILLQGAKVEVYPDDGLYQVQDLDVGESVYKIATGKFIEPELTTIQQLESNIDYFQSRLIRLDSVQFMDSELGETFADGENNIDENRWLMDCDNNTVEIRTSGYANFADSLLPTGMGTLVAIASVYYDAQLVIRTYSDVQLNGARCGGGGSELPEVTTTIPELKALYQGQRLQIEDDLVIGAHVVANDESGNYYKTIVIQDGDGGIELKINDYDLYQNYPEGQELYVKCKDLYIDTYGEVIQLGSIYEEGGSWNFGGIQPGDVFKHIVLGPNNEPVTPTLVNVNDINEDLIGMLIRLDEVQFTESELGSTWADAINQYSVNHNLENCDGDVIVVRTSGYANFASVTIPDGNGTFIGVVSAFNGTMQLYVRQLTDVDLSGERCDTGGGGNEIDPVESVSEYFDDAVNYTDIEIDGWTNLNVVGTRKWQGKVFNDDKYAQSTGYNSGLPDMEVWMITPPVINSNGDKTLSFKSAMAYWEHSQNDPITIYASTDYDGTNFSTAVWTEITANLPTQSSANYEWIPSGDISLAGFTGNVAIAFKYKGSDSESTSIQIDDVVITGSGGGGSTIFTENFDAGWGGFEAVSLVGSQVWERDNTSGPDGSACADISGYELGYFSNNDWLISPAIDLSTYTSATLLFESARNYDGAPIEIKVSTDYTGNPNSATWTTLSATLSQSGFNWVSSGNVNLSSFTGQAVYIAFQYTSTTQLAATWRVDNIEVKAE